MWPNMEIDRLMGRLDAIRDIIRIAYGSEGDNCTRLFATARDMLRELADDAQDQIGEEDDE